MFGKNKARKQQLADGQELEVKEIFTSIQGEGPKVGVPSVFIRLAGCNLRCFFCDTDFDTGKVLNVPDILNTCKDAKKYMNINHVVITGGEPLRQNIIPLLELLGKAGFTVEIETSGTLWIAGLKYYLDCYPIDIICSPKTSLVVPDIYKNAKVFKYVVVAGGICKDTGLPCLSTQQPDTQSALFAPWPLADYRDKIYIQPCFDKYPEQTKRNTQAAIDVVMRHGYRLSIQVNKILDMP